MTKPNEPNFVRAIQSSSHFPQNHRIKFKEKPSSHGSK